MATSAAGLRIFRAESGFPTAAVCSADGSSRLLHSAHSPEREREDLALPEIWGDVVLCLGTGLGYHLEALRTLARPLTIVLCDRWPELVASAKAKLEGSPHRLVCLPLDPYELPANARVQIVKHPASYRSSTEAIEEYSQALLAPLVHQSKGERASLGSAPRVLLLHGWHFLQSELRHAIEEMGGACQLCEYERFPGLAEWDSHVFRLLQEFQPDLILSINMKGIDSEGVLVDHSRRLGVPLHVWFVDDPRPIALAYPERLYPYIQVWCWERSYLPWLKSRGFSSPRWLALAGDPLTFSPDQSQPPRLDLVFTGASMGHAFLEEIRRSFLWDDRLGPLVEQRSEELLKGARAHEALLAGASLPFQDERNRTWLTSLIQHTASHKRRKRLLLPWVEKGLVCAGDPEGWRATLGVQVRTLPDVPYRRGLCSHYRSCKMNLNVTSCQMPSAVNQRVFDVPLSGAFLLTDAQSDLAEQFEPSEVATYGSAEELRDKILWYQGHPGDCVRVVEQARKRILQQHTYVHRLGEILRVRSD